jgi:hypothetical protein
MQDSSADQEIAHFGLITVTILKQYELLKEQRFFTLYWCNNQVFDCKSIINGGITCCSSLNLSAYHHNAASYMKIIRIIAITRMIHIIRTIVEMNYPYGDAVLVTQNLCPCLKRSTCQQYFFKGSGLPFTQHKLAMK